MHPRFNTILRKFLLASGWGMAPFCLGLIVALMSTRALRALLYSVSSFDVPTFVVVTVVLGIVALAASYVPALRASRLDPMAALRYE